MLSCGPTIEGAAGHGPRWSNSFNDLHRPLQRNRLSDKGEGEKSRMGENGGGRSLLNHWQETRFRGLEGKRRGK